ncbi:segregation/condensation protein A [Actinomycetaceae bacterium TAE3-ERU4]|nr:segregation/condensation protein A [Actinomycetaceae bacterium TAE3-ERU4]
MSEPATATKFEVHLDNFEGPFDLLLSLIARRKLDVTQLALAQVTEEFLSYMPHVKDFSQTSEFMVVAATLLDLKAARLLPTYDESDEDTLAVMESADRLFARLLRYRAFKKISESLKAAWENASTRIPRLVPLEDEIVRALPPLRKQISPELLGAALSSLTAPPEQVEVGHVHVSSVSVFSQATLLYERLTHGSLTFSDFIADSPSLRHTVCRFLAVLNLYRENLIDVEQETPGAQMVISVTGKPFNADLHEEYEGSA